MKGTTKIMFKKILCTVFCLIMLAGVLMLSASAEVGDYVFYEVEYNSSSSYADRVYDDYTIHGTLSDEYDMDYYKFVLSSRSDVLFVGACSYSTIYIGIEDSSGDLIYVYQPDTLSSSGNNYTFAAQETMDAGTYYICVLSSNYSSLSKSYTLYLDYESASTHTHTYSNSCDSTCNSCGATRSVSHSYSAATCTKPKTCSVCSATSGSALGHSYSDDCDTTCNRCGKTRTASGHVYEDVCSPICENCGEERNAPHKYSNACDKSCNLCGYVRTAPHKYDNSCDSTCNLCSATRTVPHSYKTTTTKATLSANGKLKTSCSVCGKVKSNLTIYSPTTFKLSATSVTYNGKVRTPTVTVKTSAGKTLTEGTDYTVTYASGRKNVGTYNVTVKMMGKYSGTKTLSFKITPVNISKCTVKLSATSVTYNGNVRTPTVTVRNQNGVKLTKDTHYTVTYASGRINAGTYKVTVKMKGNYTGTKTLSFKINPVDISKCSVALSATAVKYNGEVRTPTVTVRNANGVKLTKDKHYTVTYASGRKNVGTYNITVKMKGNYTGSKTLTFTIKPTLSSSVDMFVGETLKIGAKSNAKITYKSSNTAVAKVSSSGVITAVKSGTVTITVTSNKVSQKITVKVTKPSISLDKTTAKIGRYDSLTLKATTNPSNVTVKWTSSNTAIAKVSSKGKITPVKAGTCKITASFEYKGKTYKATCSVTIESQQAITITAVDWDINSVDGVEPEITIRNNTNKDIKYIEMETEYRNRYGDPAYCEIRDSYTRTLRVSSGLSAKTTDTFYWDPAVYNGTVHRVDINKVTVTFVDGSVVTIDYYRYWYDSYYYYQ